MNPQSEIQRFLCVIEGGLSPTVVGGPYRSEADLTAGLIQAINTSPRLADPEGDTIHALDLGRGRPRMQDFAGGFMDQLRRLARGEAPDDPVWLIYAGAEVLAKDRRGPGVMTGSSKKCRRKKCSREGDVPAHPQAAVRWAPLQEEVRSVPMDPDLAAAYRHLETDLKAAVRDALRKGSRGLLRTYLHTLLAYPDKPYGFPPVRDPEHPEVLVTIPETLPEDVRYAKERALLDLVKAERAQGRRVFVYAVYAERHDVVGRLTNLLRHEGVHAEALRATVAPEEREEWLERAVRRGIEVMVANPALVQTGLDLIAFPTLLFFETGYSIYPGRPRGGAGGLDRPGRFASSTSATGAQCKSAPWSSWGGSSSPPWPWKGGSPARG